jgi:thymidylate kinase
MNGTMTRPPTNAYTDVATTAAAFQALADEIVGRLDASGIPWCLLRNRDDIPMGLLQWADIDILVDKSITAAQLWTIFADLQPAQLISYRGVQSSFFFPVLDHFLRVDMYCGDPEYRAVPFASNRAILADRWRDRGYMVAPTVYQPYVAGISKLLWGGAFPVRYAAPLADVARQEPEVLLPVLREAFGEPLASELLRLAQTNTLLHAPGLTRRCRRALWGKALRARPRSTLNGLAHQMRLAVRERLHPTGLDVAILGPDGAGKTSLCRTIATMEYRCIPYHAAEDIGLYHHVLPTLSQLAGRISGTEVHPVANGRHPHSTPLHHPLIWFAKYLYYTADQWISQASWMRHKLSRSMLLLRDRHLMELTIDARRYRYAGPDILPHLIARLAPRPDLVILLDAPATVLFERKPDLDLAEAARQRDAYRTLVSRLPNGRIVNGAQQLDRVFNDVRTVIAEEARIRTIQRFEPNLSTDVEHRGNRRALALLRRAPVRRTRGSPAP